MARLTVCQLLPSLIGGGVERGTLEVGRGLVRAGHRSIVVSGGGPLVQRLVDEGSEHVSLPVGVKSPRALLQVRALRHLFAAQRVDVVHARSRMPAWLAWLALRGMPAQRRPHWVTTVHGLYSVSRYSAIMTRGERVIAVSEAVRDYILANYPNADAARVEVIPRGIDPAEFPYGFHPAPEWLERWHADRPHLAGCRVLTLPGRLTRLKGHDDLIELMRLLADDPMPIHALVVGGEDPRRLAYARELRRRVVAAGLQGRVTFTGPRNDIREILAISSVVFSLSHKPESFGRTVLEAIALGVPVIGYDHGGVGELLMRLYPQGRVPVGDLEVLAARVRSLLRQPVRPEPPCGYTLDEMLGRTLALYRELAGLR